MFVHKREEFFPGQILITDRPALAALSPFESPSDGLSDLTNRDHGRAAGREICRTFHAADHFHQKYPYRFTARLGAEDIGQFQHGDAEGLTGIAHGHLFLINPAADIRVPFRQIQLRPRLGKK